MQITQAATIQTDPDRFLSLKDLAGYASLSRRTLQNLVNDTSDPIPSYRVGGKILVKKSDFDRWMIRRRNEKPLAATRLAAADARGLLGARPKKRPLDSRNGQVYVCKREDSKALSQEKGGGDRAAQSGH